jgi:DNA-binding XRE family transcriptional regulator
VATPQSTSRSNSVTICASHHRLHTLDYAVGYSWTLCTPEAEMAPLSGVNPDDSLWSWLAYDLRRYREVRGLTQTHVGKIIKVTKQQVHDIESGYRKRTRPRSGSSSRPPWPSSMDCCKPRTMPGPRSSPAA